MIVRRSADSRVIPTYTPEAMKHSILSLLFVWAVGVSSASAALPYTTQELQLGKYTFTLTLQEGFEVELLTANLESPRVLHFAGDRLFIGSRSGNVYWLDPPYTKPQVMVTLDDYPHSVVVHQNTVYIARTSGIYAAPYTASTTSISADDVKLVWKLPGGQGHNSRTLKVGPDQRLYVSLGVSGNCSDEYLDDSYPANARRGGVAVVDPDAEPAVLRSYGSGLRNPVGFDWHPVTQALYATNNGPDHLGYEVPPEYFARVAEGSFHGMPWYQFDGDKLIRDNCIQSEPPISKQNVEQPVATFPARIAPMDMMFFTDRSNANTFANDALVALHGSWATATGGSDGDPATRREPKLVRVEFADGQAVGVSDVVSGFQLENGARWARPMGVAEGPDGDVYFTSDDGVHGLYRLRYTP